MLSNTQNFQENLNEKICIEYDIINVKFQNWDISLHNLKMKLFGYTVQKVRLSR